MRVSTPPLPYTVLFPPHSGCNPPVGLPVPIGDLCLFA